MKVVVNRVMKLSSQQVIVGIPNDPGIYEVANRSKIHSIYCRIIWFSFYLNKLVVAGRAEILDISKVGIIPPGGLVSVGIKTIYIHLFLKEPAECNLMFPLGGIFTPVDRSPVKSEVNRSKRIRKGWCRTGVLVTRTESVGQSPFVGQIAFSLVTSDAGRASFQINNSEIRTFAAPVGVP